ncbi:MAG: tyrosine-protein phosphatase [Peptoniphilaceae bacterium]|nr:tyrosine-protein phosphatase [Peptoniphilaceae bacterium]
MTFFKRIPFETIDNFRDLGGVATKDGKSVKWGKIYRSSNMNLISDNDIAKMKDLKISTVIDLRRDFEVEELYKNIDKVKNNFDYYQVSLANRNFGSEEIQEIIEGKISVGKTYRDLIDNHRAVKKILELIIYSDGAVIFHCQEGKDRTGIIAMILYGLLNVDKIDIIADYEISSAYLGYVNKYDQEDDFSVFRITNPYYMKEAYAYVIDKYNTFENYIKVIKLDLSLLDKLREKMLD